MASNTTSALSVLVIGYGVEGVSASRYWHNLGHSVTVADEHTNAVIPQSYDRILSAHYLDTIEDFDLIIRTPSVRPDRLGKARDVTSVTREFFARCPAPIIGITGTKGKGTTTTLIAEILASAGKKVWVGGNIGIAPLDFLSSVEPQHIVVLELSSFQLMDLEYSPAIAVCLMMAHDHLDWHVDMDEYIRAKSNLFNHQKSGDLAVYKSGDPLSRQVVSGSLGRQIAYGDQGGAYISDGIIWMDSRQICRTNEVGLLGPHNLENICAAITATWDLISEDIDAIRQAVMGFRGLEHRLQVAGRIEGVDYIDDSFATTPETTIAAIKSFDVPKVLILGGSDKGAQYDELAQVIEDFSVIHVFLIGDTASAIEAALLRVGYKHITKRYVDMESLIRDCYAVTEPGDVVLLSPGCASFGLFDNYKQRGDQFTKAVQAIAELV